MHEIRGVENLKQILVNELIWLPKSLQPTCHLKLFEISVFYLTSWEAREG